MDKLSAIDASFLYLETANCPQHIASVQLFELPAGREADDSFFAEFRALLAQRAHLVPHLTRKLQVMPGNIDHPVWIRDCAFNLDNHLVRIELPAPGSMAQLEAKIAELHEVLLDRTRPMWMFYVIYGLADNKIAYYFKSHHSCLDGMAGQIAYETLFDTTPTPRAVAPAPADFYKVQRISTLDMWLASWANITSSGVEHALNWQGQIQALRNVARRAANSTSSLAAALRPAPKTSLNVNIDAARTYAVGSISLTDVKAIGARTGTKVNDVFLAVCGGGLRRYLERRNELPATSLIAGCPVSLRKPGDTSMSNQVTMMQVSLETTMRDPMLRLLAIRDAAEQAKGLVADLAPASGPDFATWGMPAAIAAMSRFADATGITASMPLPINVVVSNVPGPRKTMYSNGAKMLTHFPVSIPVHGNGANITVQSYVDRLDFSLTAGARALPDAGILRDDLLAAFAELRTRVLGEVVTPPATETLAPQLKERGQSPHLELVNDEGDVAQAQAKENALRMRRPKRGGDERRRVA